MNSGEHQLEPKYDYDYDYDEYDGNDYDDYECEYDYGSDDYDDRPPQLQHNPNRPQ